MVYWTISDVISHWQLLYLQLPWILTFDFHDWLTELNQHLKKCVKTFWIKRRYLRSWRSEFYVNINIPSCTCLKNLSDGFQNKLYWEFTIFSWCNSQKNTKLRWWMRHHSKLLSQIEYSPFNTNHIDNDK